MGKLTRMLETWIDGQTLAALAYLIDLLIVGLVALVIILLLTKEPKQEVCYECGRKFVPTADTPLKTRSWPMAFCSDGCKVDYRMSRV